MLREIVYNLLKGQRLSDIEPFKSHGISTKSILDKRLPNLGATHAELKFPRHSIIIVSNVPAIQIKEKNLKQIRGVYKNIEKHHIKTYLESTVQHKKIMCTPEAYIDKVKPAILDSEFNLYQDFFILLDECERLITDVDYRAKIIAPIEDFFTFENKAMVSATVLSYSSKLFEEHGFSLVKIKPLYDYKKSLNLVVTNNLIASIRGELVNQTPHPIFIFLNSIKTIIEVIKALNLKESAKVYCSKDSTKDLMMAGIENTASELGDYARVNFLTSRFFSAVDIELPYNPNILMVTDVFMAKHSILDPFTESIQICGRFRNGIGTITHITNFNDQIDYREPSEAMQYLHGAFDTYKDFLRGYEQATNEGAKKTYDDALKGCEISKYVTEDHKLNDFMVDNFTNEQRVKSYYTKDVNLIKAYQETGHFEVFPKKYQSPVSDEDNLKIIAATTKAEVCKAVATALDKYNAPYIHGTYRFFDAQTEINKLKERYPSTYEFYEILNFEGMEACDFNETKMRASARRRKKEDELLSPLLIKLIYKAFDCPGTYSEDFIKSKLSSIFGKLGIQTKVTATLINKYFDASRSTERSVKVYKLISKLF